MDDIAHWLERLGLAHLAPLFARAEIDMESLRLLTEADLKEMQVVLGPRRKILAAIKQLVAEDAAAATSVERRSLTILFCDLVGSTEYATSLDPEDFTKLTQAYLAECTSAVRDHNGIAANYIGDAFQALFGYPVAEEDDAERALELAFDILRLVPDIAVPDGSSLRVRIGIASGLVVVGDFIGAPAGVSTVALGSIPNLAQRLQSLAEPQTVLTDQKTHDAASGAFDFTDLGMRRPKGFPADVHVWRADAPKMVENRFSRRLQLTELVGRQSEIDELVGLWRTMNADSRGRAAVIIGEPGIGKSRLVYEVQRRLGPCRQMTLQCAGAYANSPLFPFLTLLKRHAGIDAADPPETALAKLEAVLSLSDIALSDSLPTFAELLGIEQSRYAMPRLVPSRQRHLSRRILIDWLRHVTDEGPVLLSIEDEHWIDPSSRDVLQALVAEAPSYRMLILITTRERQSWMPRDDGALRALHLDRLDESETQALVRNLVADQSLSAEARARLLEKSEGVPLYVEELARAFLDSDATSEDAVQTPAIPAIGLPSSIQSSLLSRLDKIGPGKTIAQVAAVVGREFDVPLVADLCGLAPPALVPILDRLTEAGLIAPLQDTGGRRYAFAHALLQEAARETLLRERSRELHAQVARAIERLYPRQAGEHPEVLAQHFAEAELFERAADCWLAAGLATAKTWAKVEAANMFANGLDCLAKLPASGKRDLMQLRLELERGDVLYATFGYVTPEGSAAYRNVMRLSETLGDVEAPIRALDGLFGIAFNSARFADAEWAADELLDIGTARNSLRALVLGMQFKGMCLFCQGQFTQAKDYLERALQHLDRAEEIGSDFPSMSMLYLSWTLQITDDEAGAMELYLAAEKDARRHSVYRLAACLGNCCVLHAIRDDYRPLREKLDELSALAAENGFRMWLNVASFFQAWITVKAERDREALERMRKTCENLGDQEIDKTCYLALLAGAYIAMDDLVQATVTVSAALDLVAHTGENYFTAELLRLQGEINARLDPSGLSARASFLQSLEVARHQGADLWTSKTLASLSALPSGG
ncbi:adenylate/guanylate cyclase domain-containing protein [Rhizobium sp. S152]|uniref:ATP-binding protein n=1 Tax=Rhizobium sp. S152 TaxID=3055038 RepID=UPI0025AA2AB6|nr:adenylate/guanylate cyclase domain-containing protein [Rhizobium sp. S152]MDM9625612.1 adenylate/guanylate cyclase domain-containing protein [Rhizobium sp. S152]